MPKQFQSHGSGNFTPEQFKKIGANVIFENGVLVFHPENIKLGNNIYIGHNTILKGYYKNLLSIGDNVWIGQNCFFHSAGGIEIGANVGIAPNVKILTSFHTDESTDKPILFSDLKFRQVIIKDDADIGIGSIIMPGVSIGKGVQIGAGSIVTKDIPDFAVAFGSPAKVVRYRN